MSAWLVAQVSINDRERYALYEAGFMEILIRYGGKIVAVDEAVEVLEGSWDYTRTVLVSFDSADEARRWYSSEAYQALAANRWAASEGNVILLKGLSQTPT